MKRLFLSVATLALLSLPANAQDVVDDAEKEAVRRTVETYLYAEESGERKSPLSAEARIYGIDSARDRIKVTPLSKSAAKEPKGSKILRSRQKIVSIDVVNDGASVKVSTDLTPDDKADEANEHFQFIWLLKAEGEWKVVGILMPGVAKRGAASR